MQKKIIQFIELTIAAAALIGVILIVWQSSFAGALNLLSYYTIQTNLLVATLMIYRAFHHKGESKCLDIATTSVTIWIFITGAAYHFLLSASHTPSGLASASNILIHYVTPIAMVIYYLTIPANREKGTLFWLSYPALYFILTLIRGVFDGFYPYWFLYPSENYPEGIGSYQNVLLFALIMGLVYLVTGYILHGIKNRLALIRQSQP